MRGEGAPPSLGELSGGRSGRSGWSGGRSGAGAAYDGGSSAGMAYGSGSGASEWCSGSGALDRLGGAVDGLRWARPRVLVFFSSNGGRH